ncbi:hypothetical protein K466DRAFT_77306 [Polyporus arcularius HHB13444]|uniref:Uncharacterized protein n=1 Tax=Polyporus arcularius HHB13444 TaxID=1314778 RepID=A0A5C3PFA3_9APHY|nr:hypothetical protein K466DRAFT_77306 [Polyporus arcularius HHB13444]
MYEPMLEYLRCVRTSAKRGIEQWGDENLRMSLGGVTYARCVVSWYRCIVRFEVQVYDDVRIVAPSALSDDAWLPQEPQSRDTLCRRGRAQHDDFPPHPRPLRFRSRPPLAVAALRGHGPFLPEEHEPWLPTPYKRQVRERVHPWTLCALGEELAVEGIWDEYVPGQGQDDAQREVDLAIYARTFFHGPMPELMKAQAWFCTMW